MTGIPYVAGEPLRCVRCGSLPAVRLADRVSGPWCRAHLPWLPVVGRWAVPACVRCGSKGARVVAPSGRVSGPWCRNHRPAPAAFGDNANDTLALVAERWST